MIIINNSNLVVSDRVSRASVADRRGLHDGLSDRYSKFMRVWDWLEYYR